SAAGSNGSPAGPRGPVPESSCSRSEATSAGRLEIEVAHRGVENGRGNPRSLRERNDGVVDDGGTGAAQQIEPIPKQIVYAEAVAIFGKPGVDVNRSRFCRETHQQIDADTRRHQQP